MIFFAIVIMFIFVFFAAFGSIKKNNRNSKVPLFLTFALFFFFHIFRSGHVGADTWSYYFTRFSLVYMNPDLVRPPTIENIIEHHMTIQGQFLFRMYLATLREIFADDIFWMNFGMAILILPAFHSLIKKHSKNYFLSCILFVLSYYFAQSMNVTRQYGAVALCIMAFNAGIKKNYLLFMIYVIMAISFHVAAVVFVAVLAPLLFRKMFRMSFAMRLTFIIVATVVGYSILPTMINALDPTLLNHDQHDGGAMTALANLGLVLISAYCLYKSAKNGQRMKYHDLFSFMIMMAFVTNIVAFQIHLFTRLQMWFLVFHLVIIPNYFATRMKTRGELYARTMMIGYVAFYFIFAARGDSAHIFAYNAPGMIFDFRFPWRA